MKLPQKKSFKIIIVSVTLIILIFSALYISMLISEPLAHISPGYPKEDLAPILSKQQLDEKDYKTIYFQTGLAKPAVDDLRLQFSDSSGRILRFQKYFFSQVNYVCEKNSPISKEESVVDVNGKLSNGTEMAPLQNGDILITKSSHVFGWRNGHAAIIVDAAGGKTLESIVLGTNSTFQDISKWTNYPNFMVLRLKNSSRELTDDVAKTAVQLLFDKPYVLTVGIFSPKLEKRDKISGTNCSHLVWEAFSLFGYNLDSDGGLIVTPKDIANSSLLEVVQVFGVNPENIWP